MDHGKRLWEETVFHYYVLNLTIVFQKSICFCCEDFTFEIYLFCYKFLTLQTFKYKRKKIAITNICTLLTWNWMKPAFCSFLVFVFDTMMKQHLAVIFMSKVRFSSVALYWHICSFLLGFCERYILPICNKIFFLHFQLKFILPEK